MRKGMNEKGGGWWFCWCETFTVMHERRRALCVKLIMLNMFAELVLYTHSVPIHIMFGVYTWQRGIAQKVSITAHEETRAIFWFAAVVLKEFSGLSGNNSICTATASPNTELQRCVRWPNIFVDDECFGKVACFLCECVQELKIYCIFFTIFCARECIRNEMPIFSSTLHFSCLNFGVKNFEVCVWFKI